MKILELNTKVIDKITETEGMLVIAVLDMDRTVRYVFQPRGLNPETHQPVTRIVLEKVRVQGASEIEVNLPVEVLGTEVEDRATGFKGIAVQLSYYVNGCVHFDVKPKGILTKTGDTIESYEFDYRRLMGPAIKVMSKEELKKDQEKAPSPERKFSIGRFGL